MRLLILGSGGQLGSEICRIAPGMGHVVSAVDRSVCDVGDREAIARVMSDGPLDAVINCAAYTGVDAAESHVDDAYRVNGLGPRLLAAECHRRQILLQHLSTDFVFDGTADAPLDEAAAPRPTSVYGASKLAGEEAVRHLAPLHQVVRTSWLFGMNGPNFALTMLRIAREKGALRVVADQHGTPTWTGHLAPALLRLAETAVPGTFHLTNGGQTTWHGFASRVVSHAHLDVDVAPIPTSEFPTPARRPAYSVLDNRCWRLLGEPSLPQWEQGVDSYLDSLRP